MSDKTEDTGLQSKIYAHGRVAAVLVVCAFLTTFITYVLYNYTQTLLKERLQERLIAIVATAAQEIDPNDINYVQSTEQLYSEQMSNLVGILERMREANPDITYAYIMRKTGDANTFEFVADADSLVPYEEWDMNEDGIVEEDEEIPLPGDPFDVSPYPTLKNDAHQHPVASNELEEDQWSVQLSAYAPIMDENDKAIAIVGIDVTINDFKERTQAMLLPFALFIFFLILLLTLLTLVLVRVYNQRVEVLREIDRQKDELLSIVSHQLATPVASMKWYLEMFMDGDMGKLTKEQEEHVKTLQGSASNLSDLVSMILDVSRIQLGRMKVDMSEVDLGEFFKEVLVNIEPKAAQQGVTFTKNLPKKLPTIQSDRRLLHMTLENLLSNAVKYTPKGGTVTLDVRVTNNMLRYTVKDTGCGIPKAEQGKMFNKLFRASNVQKIDGNGFGLYAAKGAVEALGGTISFKSQEGKGTTFEVSVPLMNKK